MKRIIALLMFFILMLSFTACSSKQETVQDTEGAALPSTIGESQESTDGNADKANPSRGQQDHPTLPQQTQPELTSEPISKQPETTSAPTPAEAVSDTPSREPEPSSVPTPAEAVPDMPSREPEPSSAPTPAETVPDTPPREPEPSSELITEQPGESKEEEPVKQSQFYIIVGETTFTADFADNSSADAFRELLAQGDLTIHMSDYGSFEKVGSIGQSLPREDTQISTTTGDIILYQGNQIVIFYGTNSWRYSRLGKIQNAAKDDLLTAFGSGNVTITFSLTK